MPAIELKGGDETLRKYAGKVIAIVDGEVRASGENWNECIDAATAANLADPMFMFLPTGSFVGGMSA